MKGTLGHLSASYRGKAARDQALNWLRKSVPSEKKARTEALKYIASAAVDAIFSGFHSLL